MTGMDAKVMCSCVFVAGRDAESVKQKELQVFPGLTLATININEKDSTVSASLLWKTSKAIYRKGLGCTLLAERSEEEVRSQKVRLAKTSKPSYQDTISWPQGNALKEQTIPGVDYEKINQAIGIAFADVDPTKPVNTHAVLIVYDGHIIGERYAPGFDINSRMTGWSMTKSMGNALIGILVKEGKLSVDHPAPIQEWQNDDRKKITLSHLLTATSGLKWSESYFNPNSTFHTMFIHRDDKAAFAASTPLETAPGKVFKYSSGTSNILAGIVRATVGDEDYYAFPYEKLFHKIGMNTAIIEPDASGTFVMSSYGFASARDWARLGLLYLNDGVWDGERILPENWVRWSTTPSEDNSRRDYGAQIWLNAGEKDDASKSFLPGVPDDAYLFEGFERNSVTIIPSRKLVVVRLGVTHNRNFDLVDLLKRTVAAVPEQ